MNQTTFQPAEIYDSNGNLIQQGAYGINTPFCTSTGDGVYDYIVNNLNALKDMIAAGYIAVATLPSSGQTNKYYVITEGANAGKCYVWTGSAWQELATQINGKSAYEIAVDHGFIGTEQQWLDSFTADAIAAANRAEAVQAQMEEKFSILDNVDARFGNIEDHAKMTDSNVDATKKRISNVEKLLQGNLYDYQTDETVAYEKTVPAGAMPYAGIEKLGGKTVVWNQVLNAISASGWKNYSNNYTTISFEDAVATITVTDSSITSAYYYGFCRNYVTLPLVVNHVYAYLYEAKSNIGNRKFGSEILSNGTNEDGTAVNADTWYQMGGIGTASKSLTQYLVKPIGGNYSDLVYSIRNAMLFDITLMFGSGNEPTTVEEFKAMFPAEYYPYNAGTLLSAGVTEVECVGVNLYDNANAVIRNGFLSSSGLPAGQTRFASSSVARCLVLEVKPNTQYTLTRKASVGGRFILGVFDHIPADQEIGSSLTATSQTVDGYIYNTFTTPQTAKYLLWYYFNSNDGGSTEAQIRETAMLTYGNTIYSYSPYTANEYPIPAEIQALDGYGWSAGTAYNYIDYERKVFVKNVGSVDLGTLTWTTASNNRFRAELDSIPLLTDNNSYPIAICPKYEGATPNNYISYDDVFHFSSTIHAIYIRDTSYSDVATFTSSVSGVYMNYVLATPIETDISAYLSDDNLIEVESSGTLTMYSDANGDDDAYHIPVPSTVEYMIDLNVATGGTENEP